MLLVDDHGVLEVEFGCYLRMLSSIPGILGR